MKVKSAVDVINKGTVGLGGQIRLLYLVTPQFDNLLPFLLLSTLIVNFFLNNLVFGQLLPVGPHVLFEAFFSKFRLFRLRNLLDNFGRLFLVFISAVRIFLFTFLTVRVVWRGITPTSLCFRYIFILRVCWSLLGVGAPASHHVIIRVHF